MLSPRGGSSTSSSIPIVTSRSTGGIVAPLIDGPSELLGERAVEAAIATSAQVTAVSAVSSPVLAELGGIAALLRY